MLKCLGLLLLLERNRVIMREEKVACYEDDTIIHDNRAIFLRRIADAQYLKDRSIAYNV